MPGDECAARHMAIIRFQAGLRREASPSGNVQNLTLDNHRGAGVVTLIGQRHMHMRDAEFFRQF